MWSVVIATPARSLRVINVIVAHLWHALLALAREAVRTLRLGAARCRRSCCAHLWHALLALACEAVGTLRLGAARCRRSCCAHLWHALLALACEAVGTLRLGAARCRRSCPPVPGIPAAGKDTPGRPR